MRPLLSVHRSSALLLIFALLIPAVAAQPVTVTTDDIDLKNGTITNASRIFDFFDTACPGSSAVQRVHPNGTYTCTSVSGGADDQNLSDVLTRGSVANTSIDFEAGRMNNITNFFASRCTGGQAVAQVFANGSYSCVSVSGGSGGTAYTALVNRSGGSANSLQGTLDMGGFDIDNVRALNLQNALTDGNISNALTIDGGLLRNSFISVSQPLNSGNISSDAISSTELASGAVTAGGTELGSSIAGPGIGISSGELNVSPGTGIVVSGDAVAIDTGVVPRKGQVETITGYWTVNNNFTVTGDLNVLGNITNTDVENLAVNGSILPPAPFDNTFDLGSMQLRWRDAFISRNLYVNGTLQAAAIEEGGNTLSSLYVDASGDTMTGPLDMDGNGISNVTAISVNNPLTDGNISDSITAGNADQLDGQDGTFYLDNINQTLSVVNDSSGRDDLITISGANSIIVDDSFEADTDDQTLSGALVRGNVANTSVDFEAGRLNNITSFFADACPGGEAVTQVFENGSYRCVDVSGGGTDDQTLSEVIVRGNTANDSIDFEAGRLNNISNFFDARCGPNSVVDRVFANGSYSCVTDQTADADADSTNELQTLDRVLSEGSFSDGQDITMNGSSTVRFPDGVQIGDGSTDAAAAGAIVIGSGASTTQTNNGDLIAIGGSASASGDSLALGPSASAGGEGGQDFDIAIGSSASASGDYAVAFGQFSNASSEGAIALGRAAEAPNMYEATFGNLNGLEVDVNVTGNMTVHGNGEGTIQMPNGVAVGKNTEAGSGFDVAVGEDAQATGVSAAIGYASEASGTSSSAFGRESFASDTKSVALGFAANASNIEAIAIGDSSQASGDGSVMLGGDGLSNASDSLALGYGSRATGASAVAVGDGSSASENLAVAIGEDADASAAGAVAIGHNALSPNQREATFGRLSFGRRLDLNVTGNVTVHGIGQVDVLNADLDMNSNDIVNCNQINGVSCSNLGPDNDADTTNELQNLSEVLVRGAVANTSIDMRNNNITALRQILFTTGEGIMLGDQDTLAGEYRSIAIGRNTVTGQNSGRSIAIGQNAETGGSNDHPVAIGTDSYAEGFASIALGYNANVSGSGSALAIGRNTLVDGSSRGIAIGRNARVESNADGGVAIGDSAVAPNGYEATFGNLSGAALDVNVTGNVTVHGVGGVGVLNGDINVSDNRMTFTGAGVQVGSRFTTAEHPGSVAVGQHADADSAEDAIAVGYSADAFGNNSVSIGYFGQANGRRSAAIGDQAYTHDVNAVALGYQSNASGGHSIAIGPTSRTWDSNGIAIGKEANATVASAVAIGTAAEAPNQLEATFGNLDGQELDVNVTGNVTVHGLDTTVQDLTVQGSCTGCGGGTTENLAGTLATGNFSNGQDIYMNGSSAVRFDGGGVRIGNGTLSTTDWKDLAIGMNAQAASTNGVGTAVGYRANASADDASVFGADAGRNSNGSSLTAIGFEAAEDNTGGAVTAVGRRAAKNNAGEKTSALGFNSAWFNTGSRATAVGHRSLQRNTGDDAVGVGFRAGRDNHADKAVMLGVDTNATATGAVAIGYNAVGTNSYEATFGNLQGEELDVNVTGNVTVHGQDVRQRVTEDPQEEATLTDASFLDGSADVYVSGGYAYVTSSFANALSIIDISDPGSPEVVGNVSSVSAMDTPYQVAVAGGYAYVGGRNSNTLAVINVTTPTDPTIVGSVTNTTYLDGSAGVVVSGRYAYVGGLDSNSVGVVDISDPARPAVVGGVVDNTNLDTPFGITSQGRYVYAAARGANATTIVDVADPTNPVVVGSASSPLMFDPQDVEVSGRYAYVTGRDSNSVTVVDVADPATPTVTGNVNLSGDGGANGGARFLDVAGDHAYVGGGPADRFSIVDVSDPANPVVAANNTMTDAHGVHVSGTHAYVTRFTGNGFTTVSVTGMETPTADIGSVDAGALTVVDSADIGNDLSAHSLSAGTGGVQTTGDLVAGGGRLTGDLNVSRAADGVPVSAVVQNLGGADADANLDVKASAGGEAQVRFFHDGVFEWSVQAGDNPGGTLEFQTADTVPALRLVNGTHDVEVPNGNLNLSGNRITGIGVDNTNFSTDGDLNIGEIHADPGTGASDPSYTFFPDQDTGLYSPGSGIVALSAGGSLALQLGSAGNGNVLVGGSNTMSGSNIVLVGEEASATADQTTVVGEGATANAIDAIVLGNDADATAEAAVAIGRHAQAPNSYEATFGNLSGGELDLNVTGDVNGHGNIELVRPSTVDPEIRVEFSEGATSGATLQYNSNYSGLELGGAQSNRLELFTSDGSGKHEGITMDRAGRFVTVHRDLNVTADDFTMTGSDNTTLTVAQADGDKRSTLYLTGSDPDYGGVVELDSNYTGVEEDNRLRIYTMENGVEQPGITLYRNGTYLDFERPIGSNVTIEGGDNPLIGTYIKENSGDFGAQILYDSADADNPLRIGTVDGGTFNEGIVMDRGGTYARVERDVNMTQNASVGEMLQLEGSTLPACDGAHVGGLMRSSADDELYYCNGSVGWEQLSP